MFSLCFPDIFLLSCLHGMVVEGGGHAHKCLCESYIFLRQDVSASTHVPCCSPTVESCTTLRAEA